MQRTTDCVEPRDRAHRRRMRLSVLVSSVSCASLLALAAACGSGDDSQATEDAGAGSPDGGRRPGTSSSGDPGTSSSSSSSGDGGSTSSSSGGGTILKAGEAFIVDVTADGQVIYFAANGNAATLEAVPAAGGQQAVIDANVDPDNDTVGVSGGAVGIWKAVDADTGLGTFSFWTKAAGAKQNVATGSVATLFAASDDGTRIAFSVNGSATSTDLAVTSTATPVATAVLAGSTNVGSGINIASQSCFPDTSFVGKRLFSAHCPGTSANAQAARLYTVADGATTPVRLDANGGANGSLFPLWISDRAGTKLFATSSSQASNGLLFDVAMPGAPFATLDPNTVDGFMLDDESAAIYRTTEAGVAGIRRGTAVAAPVKTTLVAEPALPSQLALAGKNVGTTKILLTTLAPVDELTDVQVADVTTANQTPTAIVPTATARPIGFTRGGTHVLYLTNVTENGNALKAKPVGGSAEIAVAQNIAALAFGPGGWVVLVDNEKAVNADLSTFDLKTVDLTKGGQPTLVSSNALGDFYVSGQKLVYTKLQQGAGIYAADLP